MPKTFRLFLIAFAAVLLSSFASPAVAQTEGTAACGPFPLAVSTDTPATTPAADSPRILTTGLTPLGDGSIVYDANQGVCWLADANLAGHLPFQKMIGVPDINPDGTMDYKTALKWVDALNHFDPPNGYLGHTNWQLPNNPLDDDTCSSKNHGGFGIACTHSALGNLYSVGLGLTYPASVIPHPEIVAVDPFANLQPMLYWNSDKAKVNPHGQSTFSFNTDLSGDNTKKYNYFYVLPMALGPLLGAPTGYGDGVFPYYYGPAAGYAVYDTRTHITWALNANLAAVSNFDVTGSVTIHSKRIGDVTVPLIDEDGAMLFEAIGGKDGWIEGMNRNFWAGTNNWMLPSLADLEKLYKHMNIQVGDPRLKETGAVGPFVGLQAGFYWACEREHPGNSQSPCDRDLHPYIGKAGPYDYSFNFNEGFEGTDLEDKLFYVMVYYPAAIPFPIVDPVVP